MKYKLNEGNIDIVSKEADAYLVKRKTEKKDRIHTKLSIEEVLLFYMSAFGSDAEFTVDYGGGLSKSKIRLTVPGAAADPFVSNETDSDEERYLALPTSDLAVILSITSILDFVVTAANIYTGQCVLAITSRSIEKTDAEAAT